MTDYDATRRARGKRKYRTVSNGKPLTQWLNYICPVCDYKWMTPNDEREQVICSHCGAAGVRE